MKTRITITIASLVLALLFVGETFAQPVPSSVTQQLRLSTGGTTPAYVQHRAITGATRSADPSNYNAAGAWYAWDQVPSTSPGVNYMFYLNDLNEIRRTNSFGLTQANYIARVNALGTNIEFADPDALVDAQNGLNEFSPNVIELGGPLLRNTSIDQSTFNMTFTNTGATASSFNVTAGALNTLNVNIDPGAAGNINLQNIDPLATAETILFLDGPTGGNVVARTVDDLIDADNGLTETYATGVSTISLGSVAPGGAPLLADRYVSLATFDLNFEGASGNFNIGTGGDVNTNINTGATGNFTITGTSLTPAAPTPANFLYLDAANNVRRATADDLPAGTATTWMGVDVGGNIVTGDPMGGIYRGQIQGDGGWQYGGALDVSVPTLNAGSSIVCTIQNGSGVLGTISVQVTSVTTGTPGTFNVELSEEITSASYINWIVMNP